MKKKILSVVTVALLILASALTLAACADSCGHTHTYASAWSYDDYKHWHAATCEHTNKRKNVASHTWEDGKCTVCDGKKSTQALLYMYDYEKGGYVVSGIAITDEKDIIVAQHHNGLPVVSIAGNFSDYGATFTSIEIPNGITSIDGGAFRCCTALNRITFGGSREKWNAIAKDKDWDFFTGVYTIRCADGKLKKQ